MWIYKITNIQNNKVYIGQTIRPINQRFHRHLNDATAQTQDELNQKEQYWIRFYNSVEEGYNETDAISKCGGNTYRSKTEEEMEIIKEKIRQTKIGTKNPMARKIKRTNIITNEVDIFDTVISCAKACGIKNGKTSISTRLNGQIKSPYKNTWIFEYYNE